MPASYYGLLPLSNHVVLEGTCGAFVPVPDHLDFSGSDCFCSRRGPRISLYPLAVDLHWIGESLRLDQEAFELLGAKMPRQRSAR